jgi:hypothetical protein
VTTVKVSVPMARGYEPLVNGSVRPCYGRVNRACRRIGGSPGNRPVCALVKR